MTNDIVWYSLIPRPTPVSSPDLPQSRPQTYPSAREKDLVAIARFLGDAHQTEYADHVYVKIRSLN